MLLDERKKLFPKHGLHLGRYAGHRCKNAGVATDLLDFNIARGRSNPIREQVESVGNSRQHVDRGWKRVAPPPLLIPLDDHLASVVAHAELYVERLSERLACDIVVRRAEPTGRDDQLRFIPCTLN